MAEQTDVQDRDTRIAELEARIDQLQQALETRGTISQAMGILMARSNLTPDQAFDVLRRGSQRQNRKVVSLAEEIVANCTGRSHG